MDRPPADPGDERLPARFSRSPLSTVVLWSLRQVESARVPEEVRQMQQVDVQGVALDPLPAIEQPAKGAVAGSTSIPKAASAAWTAVIW